MSLLLKNLQICKETAKNLSGWYMEKTSKLQEEVKENKAVFKDVTMVQDVLDIMAKNRLLTREAAKNYLELYQAGVGNIALNPFEFFEEIAKENNLPDFKIFDKEYHCDLPRFKDMIKYLEETSAREVVKLAYQYKTLFIVLDWTAIVKKAIEQELDHIEEVKQEEESFIKNHKDSYDFLLKMRQAKEFEIELENNIAMTSTEKDFSRAKINSYKALVDLLQAKDEDKN